MAKLPKKLQDIINSKNDYLNSQRSNLEKSVIDMQEKLLNKLISDLASELDTENGVIKQTSKNIRLINELDATYAAFNKSVQLPVVQELAKGLLGINKYNTSYFTKLALDDVTKARFDKVVNNTNDFMRTSIGVGKEGEIISGSYLDSFLTDSTVMNDVKRLSVKSVTGQSSMAEFKGELKNMILGTNEKLGGFEKYYSQYAYDVYQEYDRTYSNSLSTEFKLNYALYQGGLITESREFCIEHNNKIYTRKEIQDFSKWRDSSGVIPSYISKFPGYKGELHCGGFNCRHFLTWVPKSFAYQERPELKEMGM